MTKGQEASIGPWLGGLNLIDEPDKIKDNQLNSCVNFDIDTAGVLEPRRAFKRVTINPALSAGSTVNYLLGTVNLTSEGYPRAAVGFFRSGSVDTQIAFVANPDIGGSFTGPVLPGTFKSVVQYQNKIWYVPGDAVSSGRSSDPVLNGGVITVHATIPYGDIAFVLKDRLFIIRKASSEIYFSKATDFSIWAAPDGGVIQVNPGDNQPITEVVVVNNQIIIFKRDQTYILNYNNSPTGDGILRQISSDQGAIDAVTYNNEVYCYNARSVFKFVNGYFQDIATQLDLVNSANFDSSATVSASINIVGDTLLLMLSDTAFAMNLDTGAWTFYEFDAAFTNMLNTATIANRSELGKTVYFGDGTSGLYYTLVGRDYTGLPDQIQDGSYKPVRYVFETKQFDFDDVMTWKRCFSWFLDTHFRGQKYGDAYYRITRNTYEDVTEVFMTPVGDLMGPNTSFRFRAVAFGFDGVSSLATNTNNGVVIRGLKTLISVKPSVTRAVTV